jgi:hypothetical protein
MNLDDTASAQARAHLRKGPINQLSARPLQPPHVDLLPADNEIFAAFSAYAPSKFGL